MTWIMAAIEEAALRERKPDTRTFDDILREETPHAESLLTPEGTA